MPIEQKQRTAAFILSLANGDRSMENVTIESGAGELEAGTVLGVKTASGKYVAYDPTASDGSETAAAIIYAGVDATSADEAAAAVVRDAEIIREALRWGANVTTDAQKDTAIAQLSALGIVAR